MGRAISTHPESLGDDRRLSGLDHEPTIGAAPVAGGNVGEGWHATGDRPALCLDRALGRGAALILGDGAEHGPGKATDRPTRL
jgi:hypothetical protein